MSKINLFLSLTIFFAGTFSFAHAAEPDARELRILSFNIHIGIGMDDKLDLERTARVIKELNPDLVGIQEIDRFVERTKKVDQPAELERLTGMKAVFGKTVDLAGGEYGIAILSKYPVLEHKMTRLPPLEGEEDRGVLSAMIQLDDQTRICFCNTHFCHRDEKRRVKQAKKINELFAGDGIPTILCGDFNAAPDREPIGVLNKHWTDSTDKNFTIGNPPRVKIDYIFFRPAGAFKVKKTEVIQDLTTSDHLPVLTVFEQP